MKKKKAGGRSRSASAGKEKKSGGSIVRSSILALLVLAVAAVGVGAGLGIWKLTESSGSGNPSTKFPSFVYAPSAPKDSPKAYQAAIDHYEDMSHVPCYCGCAQAGHRSVRDCFIKSMNGSNIVYDNHGAG
ncbi:MAG: hypothetical protein IBX61_06180 [Thermoleophilia bacterium]|nr:hypothetical protein [Thermoleophilia bacterium]